MRKTDQAIFRTFLFGLPLVLILALLTTWIESSKMAEGQFFSNFNGFSGLVFGVWMTLALYLSLRLIFSTDFRTSVLARVSLFNERDEREAAITASATRNAFLTTLAVLIFLLCLSMFQVAVYKLPPEQAKDGKSGTISLGVFFTPLNSSKQDTNAGQLDYFRYSGLPLSNSAVTLFLIFWLLGSYNYFARRALNNKIPIGME